MADLKRTQLNERGEFTAAEQQNKAAAAMIEKLVLWAGQMQRAREDLAGMGQAPPISGFPPAGSDR